MLLRKTISIAALFAHLSYISMVTMRYFQDLGVFSYRYFEVVDGNH
jgi:hypothetical protein